jgi:hypothetical protein
VAAVARIAETIMINPNILGAFVKTPTLK